MNTETAFFYYVAIHGAPENVIDRYASYFDASNYTRAMADEFERARYKAAIRAKIDERVRRINFEDKFTVTGEATLAEYSFASRSFPIMRLPSFGLCLDAGRTFFGNCTGTVLHVDVFRQEEAVNTADFSWYLPMSETEARAFVKSRSIGNSGGVDRRVIARITYSVVNIKGQGEDSLHGRAAAFRPLIHSVEVFTDESLSRKLGVVPQLNSTGLTTSAQWRSAAQDAEVPSRTIGEYRYVASYQDNHFRRPDTPIPGIITLTDVGLSLSGEQPEGTAKPLKLSFSEAFAATLDYYKSHGSSIAAMRLQRFNFDGGSRDYKDYRIVWDPVGTGLVFSDLAERDRFFNDLSKALQEWSAKHAPFAVAQLRIE